MSIRGRTVRSGALAGAVSVAFFTWVHYVTISDIWAMFIPMTLAGALSGAMLAWSYSRLVSEPKLSVWLGLNGLFVAVLFGLGIVSVLLFEPQTTMAAVVAANQPPDEMIRQALPLTVGFTVAAAVGITATYRGTWRDGLVVLLTSVLLVGVLGLNVSALGLIEVPAGGLRLVTEFFGLILVLAAVFAGAFTLIERVVGMWVAGSGVNRRLGRGTELRLVAKEES